MESFITLLLCVVIAGLWPISCLFISFKLKGNNNGYVLPPGPWGLPILGHLHMLGDLPHRNLQKLAKKFGPIMYIRLGLVPTIVVSSPEAAELFLKTHDVVFANRPKVQAAEYIAYGQRNLAFGQYGPQWRNLRKLCMSHLLSGSNMESMKSMRKQDVRSLATRLFHAAEAGGVVVDISANVGLLIEEMTFGMIVGRGKDDDDRLDLKSSGEEIMRLVGAFNLADYVPFIGALDLQGLGRRMKAISKVMDGFLETIIDEHVRDAQTRQGHDHHRDFVDVMLSLMESDDAQNEQLDRPTIKALILDMIAGALDSSSTAIEWTLSELLRNPRVMKRVQSEMENVIGMDRMVEESDLVNLHYLDAVVKESMRLHPVAPLLAPHESREDITINGYYIPKNSRVLVNFWAIGRDPRVWSTNVEEFYPERFLNTNMEFNGRDMRFIPFGTGRRGCPALQLGVTVVRLVIAQLVHCFAWELPNGMSPDHLDMTENFGLTLPRANHLLAIPTFRLDINEFIS